MSLQKILSKEEAIAVIQNEKNTGGEVVFTNGCFDIIHLGHVDYLEKAKTLGTMLVVAVNSDASVKKQNKGKERPIVGFEGRAGVLAGLESVDVVVEFGENTPLDLINALKPDVLVKGADYSAEQTNEKAKDYIVGSKEVSSWGGRTQTIAFLEGFSTTKIVEKIIKHA